MMSTTPPPPSDDDAQLLADLPHYLTIEQTAKATGFSTRQVRRWIDNGSLPARKPASAKQGAVRIPRNSLARFMQSRAV